MSIITKQCHIRSLPSTEYALSFWRETTLPAIPMIAGETKNARHLRPELLKQESSAPKRQNKKMAAPFVWGSRFGQNGCNDSFYYNPLTNSPTA
ncbi:hypothetical protein CWI35_14320 [[Bacillus] caldolyticus]|uniref:Uncharacterized protein n=1 Tax=Bacillus caldolyticus TaxID=1394 RepID=A0ABM6QS58_BACCL|nr:hypothetical protein CWI35_14320 [[Bacillus] caldolyticus]